MPNENNNAVADFLNTIQPDVFQETPVDQEVIEDKEDKALPFHKDPKVQRYVDKQIEKALKDVRPIETQRSEKVTPSDVQEAIDAFTAIIGNDTPEKVRAIEKYEKALKGSDERVANMAIERFRQEQQDMATRQTEAEKQAINELEEGIGEVEETYDVDLSSNAASAKKLRSDFIDYIRDVAPKDATGEVERFPDLLSAFKRFQNETKTERTPTRAKELASRGMTRSSDTTTTMPQGRSWKDVDRYFDKLKAGTN